MDYLSDLKREFSLPPSQRVKAEYYLEGQLAHYKILNAFNDAIQLVGIHVRRGDMMSFKGIRTPPSTYFQKAMAYLREKFKGYSLCHPLARCGVKKILSGKMWCTHGPVVSNLEKRTLVSRCAVTIPSCHLAPLHDG